MARLKLVKRPRGLPRAACVDIAHAFQYIPCTFLPKELMAELDECLGEFMWGSLVFYRQWGVQARDLLLRPPEWCALRQLSCCFCASREYLLVVQ